MEKILGIMRNAIDTYKMIEENDVVAVGCSGGKDSSLLLAALHKLSEFYPKKFSLKAITIDMGNGADFRPLEAYCEDNGIEYHIIPTNIARIVFDVRQEENPCSLCSKMRRGALNNAAVQLGANKVALAHHRDDASETLLMNLIYEGRIGCFQPVTYLSRKNITVIRPFVFVEESVIAATAQSLALPVVPSLCRADKYTEREATKDLLSELEIRYPGVKKRIFGAVKRSKLDGWNLEE